MVFCLKLVESQLKQKEWDVLDGDFLQPVNGGCFGCSLCVDAVVSGYFPQPIHWVDISPSP